MDMLADVEAAAGRAATEHIRTLAEAASSQVLQQHQNTAPSGPDSRVHLLIQVRSETLLIGGYYTKAARSASLNCACSSTNLESAVARPFLVQSVVTPQFVKACNARCQIACSALTQTCMSLQWPQDKVHDKTADSHRTPMSGRAR